MPTTKAGEEVLRQWEVKLTREWPEALQPRTNLTLEEGQMLKEKELGTIKSKQPGRHTSHGMHQPSSERITNRGGRADEDQVPQRMDQEESLGSRGCGPWKPKGIAPQASTHKITQGGQETWGVPTSKERPQYNPNSVRTSGRKPAQQRDRGCPRSRKIELRKWGTTQETRVEHRTEPKGWDGKPPRKNQTNAQQTGEGESLPKKIIQLTIMQGNRGTWRVGCHRFWSVNPYSISLAFCCSYNSPSKLWHKWLIDPRDDKWGVGHLHCYSGSYFVHSRSPATYPQ